jgi:hypothetical protein
MAVKKNTNLKHLVTPLSAARGPMNGGGDCGTLTATGGNCVTSGILQKR